MLTGRLKCHGVREANDRVFPRSRSKTSAATESSRYWTKYQYLLVAAAVLIVAGTGAWRLYGHYRDEAAQAASAKYEAAAQLSRAGKSAEATAAFDALSKTAPKGYSILARLRAADERAASDPQAAIKAYEALAADPSFDPAFKDFAKLRAAMLRTRQRRSTGLRAKIRAARLGVLSLSQSDPGAAWPCRVEAECFRHCWELVRRDRLRPAGTGRGPYARRGSSRSGSIRDVATSECASWSPACRKCAGQVTIWNDVNRRDHRPAKRWQIDAVQPARREKARESDDDQEGVRGERARIFVRSPADRRCRVASMAARSLAIRLKNGIEAPVGRQPFHRP